MAAKKVALKGKENAAPVRVQPSRVVKTKEYRDAHHTSWGVHTHHHPKDPNMYYALCLSALVQLRSEKRNATLPRILEIVKSKVTAGAFSVRSKVRMAVQKMLDSGRAQITARGVISLKSKKSTTKKAVTKRSSAAKKKPTTKKAAAANKKRTTSTKKKAAASKKNTKKAAGRKRVETVEEAPAPAAKKARKSKKEDTYIWEYKEHDKWFPYAPEASVIVEKAYKDYLADPNQIDVRSVQSGMWAYQVDFTNMTQTNIQHQNHTTRDIRRTLVAN